jgi:hypothetical protein
MGALRDYGGVGILRFISARNLRPERRERGVRHTKLKKSAEGR